jgi:hypothetical protein
MYDKVPIWKAGLSIAGPSAEGTQARPGRPFTRHEKVQKVVSHLQANKLLEPGRAIHSGESPKQRFCVEAMSARRAAIPPLKNVPNFLGLSLSLSAEPDEGRHAYGALFLLEDFRKFDDDPPMQFSSYSWLALLGHVIENTELPSLVAGLDSRFATDPIKALSQLGAIFGPEQRVTALYRVRATCMESQDVPPDRFTTTTIGYPLVVTAGQGILDDVI